MPELFGAGHDRETLAILLALVKLPFMGERIWQAIGQPYWHGVNLNFHDLLGSDEFTGDADIIGIPAINGAPDFDAMFAIEVKTYKFDFNGNLRAVGHKLDEADAQAHKLRRLGFEKTGILHVLTTENKPEQDQGGSHGWWDASDRALGAYDQFEPLLAGRVRLHHVFVWPCGAHPSKSEDQAGAGCPFLIGEPEAQRLERQSAAMRVKVVDSLKAMIANLPKPPVWGQTPWPTVFGRCVQCAGVIQYFWNGTVCQTCRPTLQPGK